MMMVKDLISDLEQGNRVKEVLGNILKEKSTKEVGYNTFFMSPNNYANALGGTAGSVVDREYLEAIRVQQHVAIPSPGSPLWFYTSHT